MPAGRGYRRAVLTTSRRLARMNRSFALRGSHGRAQLRAFFAGVQPVLGLAAVSMTRDSCFSDPR